MTNLEPAIVGGPCTEGADNECDLDNISNPDSLFFDNTNGYLWIGEDTGNHVNNMIWRYDPATEELKRFATLPTRAEATGVMTTPAGDMFISVQHPSAYSAYPYNRAVVIVVNGWDSSQSFTDVGIPEGDDMHTVILAAGEAQVIQRTGELIPNAIYGHRFGQVNRVDGTMQLMCNHPDGNIFIHTVFDYSEGYLYTNYECRPGNVAKIYIKKFSDGWQVYEGENVDFADVRGTWNNCGSSWTPWKTVLTSEEYEPYAFADTYKQQVAMMSDYLGEQSNPYDFGYLVELSPDKRGNHVETQVTKHYAMGRFSHEMALVMPDGQTVY